MKISNYDEFEYDYSTYWKNRNYEHFAETIALKKILNDVSGNWFLDIGGSFGRHLPVYYSKFKHPIITDYSLNTLINNKFRILEKYPNTSLIAANAYYLPFRDSVFDGSMMVRVLHHIEEPKAFFDQLKSILSNKGVHVQEFANKIHIKARIRNLIKINRSFFSTDPYQQPTLKQFEGSNNKETVFLNFHPKYILKELKDRGFNVISEVGVSFLRSGIVKKFVPIKLTIFIENMLQKIYFIRYFAPSVFFKTTISKENEINSYEKLEDILVCPRCKSDLKFKNEHCECTKCKSQYEKVAQVWDFRVE